MYNLEIKTQHNSTTAHQFVKNVFGVTNGLDLISKNNKGKEVIIRQSEFDNLVVCDRYNGDGICVMVLSKRDESKLKELISRAKL